MRVSLSNNDGDGSSIDAMVAASKEFVTKMDDASYARVRKNFRQFRESWTNKYKRVLTAQIRKGSHRKHIVPDVKKEQQVNKPHLNQLNEQSSYSKKTWATSKFQKTFGSLYG